MEKQNIIGDYIIVSKLGTGSYGVVYKVKKKNENIVYVLKQIPLENLTSKQLYEVKQEAKILSSINSIYVVKYYDSFEENNRLNIVMEYCDGGDLAEFINNNKKTNRLLKEDLVWKLFIKITIGLAQIHNLKILHRDIKPLNIFLTKNLDVKIGDLGVAKILTHTKHAKTFIGTPYYLSPEICQDIPYTDKSDVWALGCILYELCTYRHPFEAKSQGALILKILKNMPAPIHNYYSNDLQEFIYYILEKDQELRPSCYDILMNHIVLNKARQYGLINQILNLYPYINNNNLNYNYYHKKEIQYDYNNNNDIYEYYNTGFNNNILYHNNNGYQNNYYYESGDNSKNYYGNNYKQNIILSENNINNNQINNIKVNYNINTNNIKSNINNNININNNANNKIIIHKKMNNSNSEGYIKNVYIKKNTNVLNDKNKLIKIEKNINSFCIDKGKNKKKDNECIINNNNNIVIKNINNGRNEIKKISISPRLKKHKSDDKIIKTDDSNNKKKVDVINNYKIAYINSKNPIRYIKKPIKSENMKELFRNRSNDNIKKGQQSNIEFNNRKEIIKRKNNIKELNDSNIKINFPEQKLPNNTQINFRKNISKSDRKDENKLLDTIKEFADNLNKYVGNHINSQRNKKRRLPSSFSFQANYMGEEDLKSEECPKDNARNKINKSKNSEIEISNIQTDCTATNTGFEEFKIIENKESVKSNAYKNRVEFEKFNSKEFDHPITVPNEIANINSKKINLILNNHKNLKILKNTPNNEKKENEGQNKKKDNEKEKDKQFLDNLYSSEDEKNGNIYDSEEESESKSETVKEIKERKVRDSSMTRSMVHLSKEEIHKRIKNEIENLKERIDSTKNDMLKLIGKDDYIYIIGLYSKVGNNSGEIDEIYKKIEEYVKDKYPDDIKENFANLYLSLISYDCQLNKKEDQLKKYS